MQRHPHTNTHTHTHTHNVPPEMHHAVKNASANATTFASATTSHGTNSNPWVSKSKP